MNHIGGWLASPTFSRMFLEVKEQYCASKVQNYCASKVKMGLLLLCWLLFAFCLARGYSCCSHRQTALRHHPTTALPTHSCTVGKLCTNRSPCFAASMHCSAPLYSMMHDIWRCILRDTLLTACTDSRFALHALRLERDYCSSMPSLPRQSLRVHIICCRGRICAFPRRKRVVSPAKRS